MGKIIFEGNSTGIITTLRNADGTGFEIDPSWEVVAGLRDHHSKKAVAGPWTVLEATAGSVWSDGTVVVNVQGVDTAGQSQDGLRDVELEVKVTETSGAIHTFVSRDWVLEKTAF